MKQRRRTHFELRAAMRTLGVTKTQLSRACGVDFSTVWRWIDGKTIIPVYAWTILALLDEEEPDDIGSILKGMPKDWDIEYDDVFPNGESYKDMIKIWHPDKSKKDTTLEMTVINEFKNFS